MVPNCSGRDVTRLGEISLGKSLFGAEQRRHDLADRRREPPETSVLLAARRADHEVAPAAVAEFAKTDEERLCAAARKLRLETAIEAPPVRGWCVDRVVAALDEHVDVATGIELVRVADRLLELADREPVGPGTPRMTMAGAAVYAADRLTPGKALTQAEVVAAVATVLPTSKGKIGGYSRKLRTAAERRHWSASVAGLVSAD